MAVGVKCGGACTRFFFITGESSMRHIIKNTLILSLLCALVLGVTGCQKKLVTTGTPAGTTQPTPPVVTQVSGLAEAERAFQSGDMVRAEQIATALTSRPGLAGNDAPRAWRILALSASANGHVYLTVSALDRWRQFDPQADSREEWQAAWKNALAALPPYDARTRAQAITGDESRPWELRADMQLFLSTRQWESGDAVGGLIPLVELYNANTDKGRRMRLEHSLYTALHDTGEPALSALVALTNLENEGHYPYVLILLEDARRFAENPENLEAATEEVAVLKSKNTLADPSLFDGWLAAPVAPVVTPLAGRTLAMALPLSGQYGAIGSKVAAGAEIARKEFEAAGYTVNVVLIDTQNAGWTEQIASLPPEVTLVGGPIRAQDYASARERGLTANRAFLTFLPALPSSSGQDEGNVAWRFFPSNDDQIAALLRLTKSLGISNYAILMPDDAYANRMADIFEQHVQRGGDTVIDRAVYPDDQAEWNKFMASFLHTNKNATRPPNVSYQAIFLPDSWKHMENLVPNLFYFRENRQVLLGTTLWEQALAVQQYGDSHYYGLAVFPGPWKIKGHNASGESLRLALARQGQEHAEFWNGLGYDFVRFAATLDIPAGWTPGQVNATLSRHAFKAWSMAPLHWSPQGRASQDLFLLTPEVDGYGALNMETFRANFEKAWKSK